MPGGAQTLGLKGARRPVRRATVIIQERENGAWARVGKMGVVRKDWILDIFGRENQQELLAYCPWDVRKRNRERLQCIWPRGTI